MTAMHKWLLASLLLLLATVDADAASRRVWFPAGHYPASYGYPAGYYAAGWYDVFDPPVIVNVAAFVPFLAYQPVAFSTYQPVIATPAVALTPTAAVAVSATLPPVAVPIAPAPVAPPAPQPVIPPFTPPAAAPAPRAVPAADPLQRILDRLDAIERRLPPDTAPMPPAAQAPVPDANALAAADARGLALLTSHCASCHEAGQVATAKSNLALLSGAALATLTDEQADDVIRRTAPGARRPMPPAKAADTHPALNAAEWTDVKAFINRQRRVAG
jgi:mono/diheme cytochrome c family protein